MNDARRYHIPQEPGRWRAITLAAVVHLALVAFLWIGIRWHSETPVAVEAEIWSPQTQQAAPKPEPTPEPEPEPTPVPKAVQPPQPAPTPTPREAARPVEQPVPDPEIAIEQQRKKRLKEERERRLAEEREEEKRQEEKDRLAAQKKQEQQRAEDKRRKEELAKAEEAKERKREEEQKRKDAELAKQKQEAEEKKKLAEAEKKKKLAEAEKKKKLEQAEAAREEAVRKEDLNRMLSQAAGSGGSGEAAHSSGPSRGDASYVAKVAGKIRSNTVFNVPDDLAGNPPAEFAVDLLPDGSVRSIRKLKSSGVPGFDEAVRRAIEKSQPFPKDKTGQVPSGFTVSHKPKDQ